MTEPLDYGKRFEDLLTDAGLERFQREPWFNPRTGRRDDRVLGRYVVSRWIVSRDWWDSYIAPVVTNPNYVITYGGAPVEVDDSLPGDSVVMETVPNAISGQISGQTA